MGRDVMTMLADCGIDVTASDARDGSARPKRMTTFRAYGWTRDGKVLFAHHTRNWQLVKTVRLAPAAI